MQDFIINNQTIKAGESKQVILNSYELHTKNSIDIPVFVFRSGAPGPTILFSAGMHGEETNGIEIVRKLITHEQLKNLKCGNIIAIPVINSMAFLMGSRDLPDGRDLNRCFPGKKNGSFGSRIAFDMMQHIVPLIDFGIDFHTGGAKINNTPQIRCVFEFPKNIELAKQFSPPIIIDSVYRDGTFRKEAAKKGKPILVYEGGESMRFNYTAINEGINGCLRLLKSYNMIDIDIPNNHSVKILKDSWIRANTSGLFHVNVSNGSYVNKGNLLGVLCNPFGTIEHKVRANIDGYIVGINNQPVVNQGDALIHIGAE